MVKDYNKNKELFYRLLDNKIQQERIPFWQVGDLKFSSRNKADVFAKQTNQYASVNYCKKLFDSMDHTFCPGVEIYAERLQQLRDSYDCIRLLYSGGADSKLILDTSYKHNIPIDCIIVINSGPDTDDIFNPVYHELARANQHVEHYLKKFPNTQYHYLKFSIQDHKNFNSMNIDDWIEMPGNNYYNDRPQNQAWYYTGCEHNELFWEPYKKNIKHCDIVGKEPPHVVKINNEFYVFYNDESVDHHAGPFCEWFYVTPDMPDVLCYQSHKTMNYLIENNLQCTWQCNDMQWIELKKATGKDIDFTFVQDQKMKGTYKNMFTTHCYPDSMKLQQIKRAKYLIEHCSNIEINFPFVKTVARISDFYSLEHKNKKIKSSSSEVNQIWKIEKGIKQNSFSEEQKLRIEQTKNLWTKHGIVTK